jgi:putative transposase
MSPATIGRLKSKWVEEHQDWQKRSLRNHRYVYIWADGIYFNIRADERQCILVIIGVTDNGNKQLLGLTAGYRESELSWKPLLLQLKDQGLKDDEPGWGLRIQNCKGGHWLMGPWVFFFSEISLGFWKALPQVFPTTKKQRCWVHKTAHVLNKLPKRQQPEAKQALWQIYRADTKAEANTAFDRFLKTYQVKYPEATECLSKDREALLAFFDFPAEHWAHIRSTNPFAKRSRRDYESTFATVRLRTDKTRGCVSKDTILALVFKLVQSAEKRWLRIRGFKYLADVIEGVPFKDGLRVEEDTHVTDQMQDAA